MENIFDSKNGNAYLEELKTIYAGEIELNASLPEKIQNAPNEELADALKRHLKFTKQHLKRLEDIFIAIGESAIVIPHDQEFRFD